MKYFYDVSAPGSLGSFRFLGTPTKEEMRDFLCLSLFIFKHKVKLPVKLNSVHEVQRIKINNEKINKKEVNNVLYCK